MFTQGWGYRVSAQDLFGHGLTLHLKNLIFSLVYMWPEDGALTQLYLATSPEVESQDITGAYFTPVAKRGQVSSLVTVETQVKLWEMSLEMAKPFMS